MADETRVRFTRTKRYPHPNGPRRYRGDEVNMDTRLATRWERNGLVEFVNAEEGEAAREDDPVARLTETNVGSLAAALDEVDDPALVREAMATDERTSAQRHYEARLAELTE